MTAPTTLVSFDGALAALLLADPALTALVGTNVHPHHAPPERAYVAGSPVPAAAVTWTHDELTPTAVLGATVLLRARLVLEAVGPYRPAQLAPVAERLVALVDRWSYTDADGVRWVAAYRAPTQGQTLDAGRLWCRLGAIYTVEAG